MRPGGVPGSFGCGARQVREQRRDLRRGHGVGGDGEPLHELGDLQASGVEVALESALGLGPLGLTDAHRSHFRGPGRGGLVAGAARSA